MNRRSEIACMIACVITVVGSAEAFINPGFTPADLVKRSDAALVGTIKPAEADAYQVSDLAAIKGNLPKQIRITTRTLSTEDREKLAEMVGKSARCVLFRGKGERGENVGYCFVGGAWFMAKPDAKAWQITRHNDNMVGTYSGGASNLHRMVTHLHANPEATVRSNVGTSWYRTIEVGKTGTPSTLALVRLTYQGQSRPHVYVGAKGGDRLFAIASHKKFSDVSSQYGLTEANVSRLAAVTDIDRDGDDDLITWDGQTIHLHKQRDGKFTPTTKPIHKQQNVRSLHPLVIDGRTAILIASAGEPRLLMQTEGRWTLTPMPAGVPVEGQAGPLVVVDINRDGLPDVIQLATAGGRMWIGQKDGFAPAVRINAISQPNATVTIADLNADRNLDLYVNDPTQHRLWEYQKNGTFRNTIAGSGWLSKKAALGASVVVATDLNHDGWPDLAILPRDKPFQYHFNRGFGVFAEEGELKLTGVPDEIPVVLSRATDFNGDGAADLVVVLNDGRIFCLFNELYDLPALRLRLAGDASASPATVTAPGPAGPMVHHVEAAGPGTHVPLVNVGDEIRIQRSTSTDQVREHTITVDPINTIEIVLPER